MRKFSGFILVMILLVGVVLVARDRGRVRLPFQYAPFRSLAAGCYDGTMSLAELKARGDFGIGTVNGLDGELIELDNVFYQVKADGKVYRPADKEIIPYAVTTRFSEEKRLSFDREMGYDGLQAFLESAFLSRNVPYAIRIDGMFTSLRARSVSRQGKPYKPLQTVLRDQVVFESRDVEGTMVGFWFPQYMAGVQFPGFHFHFISKDRKSGGHVLACTTLRGTIRIDELPGLQLELPSGIEFRGFDLADDPDNND